MTKISIITCTFNASEVISRTLESVRTQSYTNIEHIIIDGRSTDDTMKKVHDYASQPTPYNIIISSEPDQGLYDAMNKGIEKATGDYLVFLNAGDKLYSEDTLLLMAEQIESQYNNPGIVYGDTDIVDSEGRFLRKRRHTPPENLTWRSFREGMLVCHQSFYAKTELAKRCPYDLSYRYSADVDWCIRVMKETEKEALTLLNTHMTLTAYLDGGMSIKNHRASLKERFRVMQQHYGLLSTTLYHFWFVIRAVIRK